MLIDAQRNRNRFDFVTSEVNTKPPKGEFAFTPPPGTDHPPLSAVPPPNHRPMALLFQCSPPLS